MFGFMKKLFKPSLNQLTKIESSQNETSLLLAAFTGIIEDILYWKRTWLSLLFIVFLNLIFFLSANAEVSLLKVLFRTCIVLVLIDRLEIWLKSKHRHTWLKKLAEHDGAKIKGVIVEIKQWCVTRWFDFLQLRESNHTKAFLLMNIIFGIVFVILKYAGVYCILYILCMGISILHKLIYPLQRLLRSLQYDIESENELDELIPKATEAELKLLSIEPEIIQVNEEKQAFESWKPEELPIEEVSDSSENSSSVVTSFSINTMHTLEKEVDSSDSSEDEYIPLDEPKEKTQLKSTLEIMEPQSSWSSSAYNALWNIAGAVMKRKKSESDSKRKRISSIDSSDGFEIIDTKDI